MYFITIWKALNLQRSIWSGSIYSRDPSGAKYSINSIPLSLFLLNWESMSFSLSLTVWTAVWINNCFAERTRDNWIPYMVCLCGIFNKSKYCVKYIFLVFILSLIFVWCILERMIARSRSCIVNVNILNAPFLSIVIVIALSLPYIIFALFTIEINNIHIVILVNLSLIKSFKTNSLSFM